MTGASLDMLRARHAMARIDEVTELQRQGIAGKYGSHVKALPATIVQIGLGQSMATLLAKAKGNTQDANHLLYAHMQHWLCRGAEHSPYWDEPDLMDAIINGDETAYVRAQSEAMAYLNWLKKFATAFLQEET